MRNLVRTRRRTTDTLDDDEAHRLGPRIAARGHQPVGHERVEPEPRRERERELGDEPHDDRHDAGDKGSHGRDHREVGRLAPAKERSVGRRDRSDDQRVEDHDVGHREEGRETTTDLRTDRRSPFGDLKEAVDTTGLLGRCGRGLLRRRRLRRGLLRRGLLGCCHRQILAETDAASGAPRNQPPRLFVVETPKARHIRHIR